MSTPSSDMAAFREIFSRARHVVVVTGAGVSAESGVPTFRGPGGFWRQWQAQQLATPEAFSRNPSRVWEFYHYRREVMFTKTPNAAHLAIAECQQRLARQGRKGKGAPEPGTADAQVAVDDLPRCEEGGCRGLLRPAVVWFGEALDAGVLVHVEDELDRCDLCLVVRRPS
ncbi:hypothetical protein CRUP_033470 [Coryphaenoides rupestris]|nr:hypothetical protein CRUP_033470 [Coryphaenoides rupestris]